MSNPKRNALVGLFVLGGLVAFGILLVKFGESRFLFITKGYIITARFDTVSGVREGTEVRLAGVQVGRVLAVELKNSNNPTEGVVAAIEIRGKYDIPVGWTAFVEAPLMGQAVINILPSTGRIPVVIPPERMAFLPKDGTAQPLHGELVNPLEKIVSPQLMSTLEKTTAQIGTLAEAMTPAATAITHLLEFRPVSLIDDPNKPTNVTANLYTTVERLHNVLKHMETVLGDPGSQSNLKASLANIRSATEDAKTAIAGLKNFSSQIQITATQASDMMVNANATVTLTRQHIDTLGKKLTASTDQLSKLLDQLVTATANINQGQGTIGMLMKDPKFYEELMLTVRRLGSAAEELRVLVKQWQKNGLLGK
jgi:hypothetical protein